MIVTIVVFFLILSVLVIAHEAGHFLAAKYFGVQVDEFGIGFPPRAAKLFQSKDGVKWTLNWLPLGGFVKLKGEDGSTQNEPDSFSHKTPWRRIVILSAGVIMNFILAFVLLAIGFSVGWPQDLTDNVVPEKYIKEQSIMIVYVAPDTPAAQAKLHSGDIIVSINGQPYQDLDKLRQTIGQSADQELEFKIERAKQVYTYKLMPRKFASSESADTILPPVGIGVALAKFGVVRYPVTTAIGLGFKNTFIYSGKILAAFYNLFKDLIVEHKVSPNLGGPVMIAALSGQAARLGIIYILQFIALLSLNLAIINFLPLPALDGGRILFVIIEKFKGRAVSMTVENWIHVIGFWLLIALSVLITVRDLSRFQVLDKLKNLIAS